MNPGIYIFLAGLRIGGNGGLSGDVNGNGVLDPGEEVLLYNTCPSSPCNGAKPGDMRFEGGGTLLLKGLSTQENMLIWVDRTAGADCSPPSCSVVRFRGDSTSGLEGRVYAYGSAVDIRGSCPVALTVNMNIVADQIEFQGTCQFTLDYDPILAPPVITIGLTE